MYSTFSRPLKSPLFHLGIGLLLLLCNRNGYAQVPQPIVSGKPIGNGYYFLNTFKIRKDSTLKDNYLMILDAKGNLVYSRKSNSNSDFKIHPNGLMSYYENGQFYMMDSTFSIVDSVKCVGTMDLDAHDFKILANGNYLLLGAEGFSKDLSGYLFTKNKISGSKNGKVMAGVIQLLNKERKVLFEWHAKEYLQLDDLDQLLFFDTALVDWTHFNSVIQDENGDFLVSSKHLCEITKVSYKDSSVIWRFGGKRNQFKFLNDSLRFYIQHDINLAKDGNLLFFDNGYWDSLHIHPCRAVEYKLDERNKTAKLVWSYLPKPPLYTMANGNVQRLTNGRNLLNYGKLIGANRTFDIIDQSGKSVFSIHFSDTLASLRIFYYPKLPFRINRPEIRKVKSRGEIYLEVDKTYPSYLWSTGETTRRITVRKTGIYWAQTPFDNKAVIYSEGVEIRKDKKLPPR